MDSIFDLRTRQWTAAKANWLGYSFKESEPYWMRRFFKLLPPAPLEEHPMKCWCQGCHLENLKRSAPKFQKV